MNDAGRDHGQIRAFANNTYDPGKAIPTVVLRNEDYGRISRLLADKQTVELEFDIVNRTYSEGRTSYNAIAEIPGATEEVVMLGGHLDSWHAATGATDNAIGCAVVMEAARILKAIGIKPRRTIRVALWSGEEQGLRGSRAYVREQFGTFEEPKPAFARFGGYVNIDSGTGRPRFMSVFGPPAAADVLRDALAPFKDLGVLGANTIARRQGFSSDYGAFGEAGPPRHPGGAGSHRVQQRHLAQQSRHLRAHCRGRCDQIGDRHRGCRVSSRHSRRAAAEVLEGRDAEASSPRAMNPEIAQLLAIIDQAYDKPSWHGTNLRGSVRRVTAAQAAWRPSSNRHNIWEIGVHAAYWKYAARTTIHWRRAGIVSAEGLELVRSARSTPLTRVTRRGGPTWNCSTRCTPRCDRPCCTCRGKISNASQPVRKSAISRCSRASRPTTSTTPARFSC